MRTPLEPAGKRVFLIFYYNILNLCFKQNLIQLSELKRLKLKKEIPIQFKKGVKDWKIQGSWKIQNLKFKTTD